MVGVQHKSNGERLSRPTHVPTMPQRILSRSGPRVRPNTKDYKGFPAFVKQKFNSLGDCGSAFSAAL